MISSKAAGTASMTPANTPSKSIRLDVTDASPAPWPAPQVDARRAANLAVRPAPVHRLRHLRRHLPATAARRHPVAGRPQALQALGGHPFDDAYGPVSAPRPAGAGAAGDQEGRLRRRLRHVLDVRDALAGQPTATFRGQAALAEDLGHLPAVVRLVQIRYPELLPNLLPIETARELAAKAVRRRLVSEKGWPPRTSASSSSPPARRS